MTTTSTAPKPQPHKDYLTDEDRPAYAAGLRHIADLVESGTCPIPYHDATFFLAYSSLSEDEQAAAARDLMRSLGGGTYSKSPGDDTMALDGMCGGVPVRIYLTRDAVCERVVVGSETVEVAAQPAVEARTETRDVIEWRCGSLLDAAAEDAQTIKVEP